MDKYFSTRRKIFITNLLHCVPKKRATILWR